MGHEFIYYQLFWLLYETSLLLEKQVEGFIEQKISQFNKDFFME